MLRVRPGEAGAMTPSTGSPNASVTSVRPASASAPTASASVLIRLGSRRLADLTAGDIRKALTDFAATHLTETVSIARLGLGRAIRHAEANDLVGRNVAALVDPPRGRSGRPSRSLSLDQATALLHASRQERATREFPGSRPRPPSLMNAYITLCLLAGVRTEEARALRWDHLDLDGQTGASPPVPPSVAVWRSVRAHGDTKTQRSRRTLGLPRMAVEALREHRDRQTEDRQAAGELWQEHGLMFTTRIGTPLDAGNVRRMFKEVCEFAGIGKNWTPRDLRTSFVSLMSNRGISSEEIARLVGHTSTRVTETVYRRELRPIIATGAEVMDRVFADRLPSQVPPPPSALAAVSAATLTGRGATEVKGILKLGNWAE
jgi:integrase